MHSSLFGPAMSAAWETLGGTQFPSRFQEQPTATPSSKFSWGFGQYPRVRKALVGSYVEGAPCDLADFPGSFLASQPKVVCSPACSQPLSKPPTASGCSSLCANASLPRRLCLSHRAAVLADTSMFLGLLFTS